MKKIALLLAIVLLVAAPLSVQAATPRTVSISPVLSFTGTTANCSVTIDASNINHQIIATIRLMQGNVCYKTWTVIDTGSLSWSDNTVTVASGKTYQLRVDAVINGVVQDMCSMYCACP